MNLNENTTEGSMTLENAAQAKTEDDKALEHIQQVLDKTAEDKDGEKDGDAKSGDNPDDVAEGTTQSAEKKPEAAEEGDKKPEDKKNGGDDPEVQKPDGDKDGEGDGETKKEDGAKPPADDKVKALLDSKVFENFRNEGVLSQEEWGTLMDGIEALLKEVADNRDRIRDISAFAEKQKAEEFSTRLDSVFDGLGDEFAEAFGKGAASKLDKALMDNRNEVLKKAETLILGYQAQGKEVSLEDAVKEAAGLWASQNFKRPTERRQQDRRGQFISKPAGEKPPAAKGDDAALDFIEKFKKNHEG